MKITKVAANAWPGKEVDVAIKEPLVADLLKAERIAGKADGLGFILALLSQVATFDGKNLPPEELERMASKDFLELSKMLDLGDTPVLPTALSTLPEKESSDQAMLSA